MDRERLHTTLQAIEAGRCSNGCSSLIIGGRAVQQSQATVTNYEH